MSRAKPWQCNGSRAEGSNIANCRAMAEGGNGASGNEPGTSRTEPEERAVVRNTLRELLFEIPGGDGMLSSSQQ